MEGAFSTKERLNAFNFLAMTRITKFGICLDPTIYETLGSPGRLQLVRDAWDVILIPCKFGGGNKVSPRQIGPFIYMPPEHKNLIKTGDFKDNIRQIFGINVYVILEACMYYTSFREEQ